MINNYNNPYETQEGNQTYLYDGSGNVSNLTSENGKNVVSYHYDVYGETIASEPTKNPYTYNAEYTDYLTGNQYLRARYYDPSSGTFLTEDSYLRSLLEPLTQNRYTYTGNDPINLEDPSGHKAVGAAIKSSTAKTIAKSVAKTVKKSVSTVKKKVTQVVSKNTKNAKKAQKAVGKVISDMKAVASGKKSSSSINLRNLVRVGDRMVSMYEALFCTSASSIRKQGPRVAGVVPVETAIAGEIAIGGFIEIVLVAGTLYITYKVAQKGIETVVENPEDLLRGFGDFITWVTQPVAPTKDSPKALGTTGNPTASKDIAVIGGAVISDALLNVLENSKIEGTSEAEQDAKSFPKDPKDFNPEGLVRKEYKDGEIIKWIDPKTGKAKYEWNKDPQNGDHYHHTPDGKTRAPGEGGDTHIKPGENVPK